MEAIARCERVWASSEQFTRTERHSQTTEDGEEEEEKIRYGNRGSIDHHRSLIRCDLHSIFFSSHIFRGFQLSADRSPCVSVSNRKRCNRQVHAPHFTSMVYVLLWAPSFIVCFDFRPNKWEKRREKQINIKFIRDTLYRTRHCSRRQHTHTRHIHNYQNGHIARLTVYARYFIKIKFYEKSKIKFWEIFPHLLLLCSESLRFGVVCVWVCVFFSFAFVLAPYFHLYFIFMVRFLAAFRLSSAHAHGATPHRQQLARTMIFWTITFSMHTVYMSRFISFRSPHSSVPAFLRSTFPTLECIFDLHRKTRFISAHLFCLRAFVRSFYFSTFLFGFSIESYIRWFDVSAFWGDLRAWQAEN